MKISEKGTYLVAEMPANLSRDAVGPIRQILLSAAFQSGKDLVLDMVRTAYLYSGGVGLITSLHKGMAQTGHRLFMVNSSGDVTVCLHQLGLDTVIPVFETDLEFELEREWELQQAREAPELARKVA